MEHFPNSVDDYSLGMKIRASYTRIYVVLVLIEKKRNEQFVINI